MEQETPVNVVIVMGVSGSGKSTVGAQLAEALHGEFFDADDFHPKANVEKMANGEGLNDADRIPWLERLRDEIVRNGAEVGQVRVLACSALKRRYREFLGGTGVRWVYLYGSRETLASRLAGREGHFMKAGMLDSQFRDLEEPSPEEAVVVGILKSPKMIVEELIDRLHITK